MRLISQDLMHDVNYDHCVLSIRHNTMPQINLDEWIIVAAIHGNWKAEGVMGTYESERLALEIMKQVRISYNSDKKLFFF